MQDAGVRRHRQRRQSAGVADGRGPGSLEHVVQGQPAVAGSPGVFTDDAPGQPHFEDRAVAGFGGETEVAQLRVAAAEAAAQQVPRSFLSAATRPRETELPMVVAQRDAILLEGDQGDLAVAMRGPRYALRVEVPGDPFGALELSDEQRPQPICTLQRLRHGSEIGPSLAPAPYRDFLKSLRQLLPADGDGVIEELELGASEQPRTRAPQPAAGLELDPRCEPRRFDHRPQPPGGIGSAGERLLSGKLRYLRLEHLRHHDDRLRRQKRPEPVPFWPQSC